MKESCSLSMYLTCQNRYIFKSQLLNPDRLDKVVTNSAHRVNYTNLMTGFMNATDILVSA